jgi:hypothetical protein
MDEKQLPSREVSRNAKIDENVASKTDARRKMV